MQTVKTKIKDWKPTEDGFYETPEGVKLQTKQLQDVCEFHKIPQTLLTIDKKYHTSTFIDVAKTVTEEIEVLTDSDNSLVQVLDPKSNFVTDEHFYEIGEMVTKLSGLELKETNSGFNKTFEFQLPANAESDTFVGDLFQKSVKIDRLPQGGVNLSTLLLRLVCSNGQQLADKQFSLFYRNPEGKLTDGVTEVFLNSVQNLSVKEYLNSIFIKDGKPLIATMEDIYSMKHTLVEITENENLAEYLYQTKSMEEFYMNQGIDCTKLSRKFLGYLPSGLTLMQAFNVLTNGAKCAEDTLENKIKVGRYCHPGIIKNIRDIRELKFQGVPHFSDRDIKIRMGDGMSKEDVLKLV